MSDKPLAELISGRGFDRFQTGLRSRFSSYRLQYELTYCEPTDNPAMRLDFESTLHRGRVTVWESGDCNLEVLNVVTGLAVLCEHHALTSENEFHTTYAHVPVLMRDALRTAVT